MKYQTLIKTIKAHKKPINGIKFSENGKKFTTCSIDSTVKIWDFNSGRLVDSVKLNNIPQIALFNKKENGYLIFSNNGDVPRKNIDITKFQKSFLENKIFRCYTLRQKTHYHMR